MGHAVLSCRRTGCQGVAGDNGAAPTPNVFGDVGLDCSGIGCRDCQGVKLVVCAGNAITGSALLPGQGRLPRVRDMLSIPSFVVYILTMLLILRVHSMWSLCLAGFRNSFAMVNFMVACSCIAPWCLILVSSIIPSCFNHVYVCRLISPAVQIHDILHDKFAQQCRSMTPSLWCYPAEKLIIVIRGEASVFVSIHVQPCTAQQYIQEHSARHTTQ